MPVTRKRANRRTYKQVVKAPQFIKDENGKKVKNPKYPTHKVITHRPIGLY